MKERKFLNFILSKFTILGLQLLAMAIFLFFIYKLNILPMKTIILVTGALVVLWLIYVGIIYSGQKKEKEKHFSKRVTITKVFSIITSIVLLLGTRYVVRGDNFINNVSNKTTETHVVSVRVLKDSVTDSVEALSGKPTAVSYQHDSKNVAEAIASFEGEMTQDFDLQQKDTYVELADALYANEVDAIIIGSEYVGMLEDKYESFKDETVEIASYKIEKEVEQTTTPTNVTDETFTVYLTGIDTYGDVSEVSRSDVNLLITVNPKTKQVLMISIPRDTEVTLSSYNAMDKLTHSGMYGTSETIETIEDFLETDINYYAKTNFTGMRDIVDQLGGITIDSPYEDFVTLHGDYTITKGINEMDGDKALCFVRERYRLPNGDFDRGKNQQMVLKAMLEKVMSPKIITNFSSLLSAIEGTFETNMGDEEIRSLLNMQINDMSSWDIFSVQVSGTGYETTKTYS
ncbi:MAG: LCP family protein, partial [Coprobacillaceae bacterium]